MDKARPSDDWQIALVDERYSLILDNYVQFLIGAISNKLLRLSAKTYPRLFGTNMNEWRTLAMLAIESDITATRICEVIGFDKAAVSRSINNLIDRGYVTSRGVKNHNKARLLSLTPSGRALHDTILNVALKREEGLLAGVSESAHRQLLEVLRQLNKNVTRMLSEMGDRDL